MKKRNKKYQPKAKSDYVDLGVVLKAFICEHDSFVTIDRLIQTIKNIGRLDYRHGVGYVYKNELGEEISLVKELTKWMKLWKAIAQRANIEYADTGLEMLKNKLAYGLLIGDKDLDDAQIVIDRQRKIYRTLATKLEKEIIKQELESYRVTEEISELIKAAA
ncbi:MAG: hypothetical protein RLZZ469_1659 [Bacteroidota bacterium]|jgi:hypothetical protein